MSILSSSCCRVLFSILWILEVIKTGAFATQRYIAIRAPRLCLATSLRNSIRIARHLPSTGRFLAVKRGHRSLVPVIDKLPTRRPAVEGISQIIGCPSYANIYRPLRLTYLLFLYTKYYGFVRKDRLKLLRSYLTISFTGYIIWY